MTRYVVNIKTTNISRNCVRAFDNFVRVWNFLAECSELYSGCRERVKAIRFHSLYQAIRRQNSATDELFHSQLCSGGKWWRFSSASFPFLNLNLIAKRKSCLFVFKELFFFNLQLRGVFGIRISHRFFFKSDCLERRIQEQWRFVFRMQMRKNNLSTWKWHTGLGYECCRLPLLITHWNFSKLDKL